MNENTTSKKAGVAERVEQLVTPVAEELGLHIWDVTYTKRGPDNYLTVTIDSDEGITIDDCEKMHHAIDPVLDEADPIADPYMLEVSSPGIERSLKYPWHFTVFVGEELNVRLYAPLTSGGAKQLRAVLTAYDEEEDVLHLTTADGQNIDLPREKAAAVNAAFDF